MRSVPWILAHQGGWDEILFVLIPIAMFAGLLAVANRRAMKMQDERESSAADADQAHDAE